MREMLRLPDVSKKTGYPRSTLYDLIRDGLFPPPVAIGSRCSAWPSDEITAIVDARIAGKSKDEIRDLVRRLIAARRKTAAA